MEVEELLQSLNLLQNINKWEGHLLLKETFLKETKEIELL
jgi:hypothetical protein